MSRDLQVRAQRNLAGQSIDLQAIKYPLVLATALPFGDLMWIEQKAGDILPMAPLRLTEDAAQQLIDDLYRAGLRPTDARGTAGQLEAMEAHLADMRKLAFGALDDVRMFTRPIVFIPNRED